MGDELAAVVVAQLEAGSDPAGKAAEAGADTLPDRLEGLEASRPVGGVVPMHSVEQWSTARKIAA